MSTIKVFALFAILFASIAAVPAFAQISEAIVVTTDSSSYSDGDTIVISGQVRDLLSGQAVTLQVISANGNRVTIEQFEVNSDKTYSIQIVAGGALWKSEGTYTIKVLYGGLNRTAETTFEYSSSGIGTPSTTTPSTPGPSMSVEDNDVEFSITGGSVKSIAIDDSVEPPISIIIMIDTTSDGEIMITLPRALIDAKYDNGDDDEFFVLIDGEEVNFDETTTASDRTLTISFLDGDETIEIIGTFAIPEFGAITAMILTVSIIAIIAVSARSRLGIMPKY